MPCPLKFTQALASPDCSAEPSFAVVTAPFRILLVDTASVARSALFMEPSGRPPAEMPVTVPDPLIVIGMIKQCSKMNRMVR